MAKLLLGPVLGPHGVPYDYIVVIDAGSKGSRVHVYHWPNPLAGMRLHANFSDTAFPQVRTRLHWKKAIKPGISSFLESPQKVGSLHLSYLLSLASAVVPKLQHHRTPIFLHATAGMRLLKASDQEPILEAACTYISTHSNFYMPDCASHVNVLDGDTEGLYGWLAINYLMQLMDRPDLHQHGKGHHTYGLLDMGGALTQVVFEPNSTEIEEHKNNLYQVQLYQVPLRNALGYARPQAASFRVFSDSFLGFGMFEAQAKFREKLVEAYRRENGLLPSELPRVPLLDPCLPKGYTEHETVAGSSVAFIGDSKFDACLTTIFEVLANATHGLGAESKNCAKLGDSTLSSCLLDEYIPAFDFDVNHFVGVSGYWDAINSLMRYSAHPRVDDAKYDYALIYRKTEELCTSSSKDLLELNNLRSKTERMEMAELAELCFKLLWILNFLHVGLGFPRFGIDDANGKFKSLQLVQKMGGHLFSWTLGRALLYANDEYVQAYNNYTHESVPRPRYFHSAAENIQYYGAEYRNVPRPAWTPEVPGTKYPLYDYEELYKDDGNVLKWYIQPHRWYGNLVFLFIIGVIAFFMLGKSGRAKLAARVASWRGRDRDTEEYELEELAGARRKLSDEFVIDSE